MAEPQAHASGNWHVAVGNESEFLARWQEFLEWTKASIPGFITASLLRDSEDPRNFVSVAKWESPDARGKEGARGIRRAPHGLPEAVRRVRGRRLRPRRASLVSGRRRGSNGLCFQGYEP